MLTVVQVAYFVILVFHGSLGATTPMHRMVSLSADVARINCRGFPTDLLPGDRPLTIADLDTARDAALAILAGRIGVPLPILATKNDTIESPNDVGAAYRGLCDVNLLLWLLPWPVCRVQSPPPRPAPVDAVREDVQRCY